MPGSTVDLSQLRPGMAISFDWPITGAWTAQTGRIIEIQLGAFEVCQRPWHGQNGCEAAHLQVLLQWVRDVIPDDPDPVTLEEWLDNPRISRRESMLLPDATALH